MSADSGSEMLDYTNSEEERKREEQRAIEEKNKYIFSHSENVFHVRKVLGFSKDFLCNVSDYRESLLKSRFL